VWRRTALNGACHRRRLGILPAQGGALRAGTLDRQGTRRCGWRWAFRCPPAEAYRIGLAQWMVPHSELMSQAMKVAEHIAGLSPMAARMLKESLNTGLNMPLDEAAHADLYRS